MDTHPLPPFKDLPYSWYTRHADNYDDIHSSALRRCEVFQERVQFLGTNLRTLSSVSFDGGTLKACIIYNMIIATRGQYLAAGLSERVRFHQKRLESLGHEISWRMEDNRALRAGEKETIRLPADLDAEYQRFTSFRGKVIIAANMLSSLHDKLLTGLRQELSLLLALKTRLLNDGESLSLPQRIHCAAKVYLCGNVRFTQIPTKRKSDEGHHRMSDMEFAAQFW